MSGIPHPPLTEGLPGIGGEIKQRHEDFIVEEVPLYTPCGNGEHTYFEIEKTDLATREAVDRIAKNLGVDSNRIGYAGLKDRRGVTRQMLSATLVEPERVQALCVPGVRVLSVDKHTNKLRIGHLRGNRFHIRVRGIDAHPEPKLAAILPVIAAKGIPNYYGPQRFGIRADAHIIGRALLRRDPRAALHRLLGYPSRIERNPRVVHARELFMAGDITGCYHAYPPSYRDELRVLRFLVDRGENWVGAARKLRSGSAKMFYSAYQSYLFNLVLTERLRLFGDPGRLVSGDLAYLHRNGAVFPLDADDPETRTRAAHFEISPSGPLFGRRMPSAAREVDELETRIAAREGLTAAQVRALFPTDLLRGGRRSLRVPVSDLEWRVEGDDLCLQFFLPKGSYATTFLRELTKNEDVPDGFYEGGEAEKHDLWRTPGIVVH